MELETQDNTKSDSNVSCFSLDGIVAEMVFDIDVEDSYQKSLKFTDAIKKSKDSSQSLSTDVSEVDKTVNDAMDSEEKEWIQKYILKLNKDESTSSEICEENTADLKESESVDSSADLENSLKQDEMKKSIIAELNKIKEPASSGNESEEEKENELNRMSELSAEKEELENDLPTSISTKSSRALNNMAFEVGQKFCSFEEVQRAIDIYSKNNNVHYWKRNAIKLDKKRRKNIKSKQELVYYYLKFACVNGGRKYEKKKTCYSNRQTQTMKIGCLSHISLLLSDDGQFLQVTSSDLVHSHETSEKLYKLHRKERRLPYDVQKSISNLMKLHVNKKLLQAKVMKETGKTVLLRDLWNIAAKFKASEAVFDEVVNNVLEKHKCSSVEILEKNKILEGLFFQDEDMKRIYYGFPDILLFDGTYKLVNLRFTCYIFLVEDGNGNSEIVGVGLLAKDASLDWLVECFKQNNPKWRETRLIMTNKDLTERGVFKESFPHASLAICLFHTLRTFKREEWTSMSSKFENFLNQTNNRLESINGKSKSVIKPYSNIADFIENFFILLNSLRNERGRDKSHSILKANGSQLDSYEASFSDLVQPFAFKHILNELRKVTDTSVFKVENQYWYSKEGVLQKVSTDHCMCNFQLSMLLPCRHIFRVREEEGIDLYYPGLVHKKWLKTHNVPHHRIFNDNLTQNINVRQELTVRQEQQVAPKRRHQKYKDLLHITNELAEVVSKTCGEVFSGRKQLLQELLCQWKNNATLILPNISKDTDTSGNVLSPHTSSRTFEEMPEMEKSFDKTAFGLKRKRISTSVLNQQPLLTKQKIILSSLIGEEKAKKCISNGDIIEENEIKVILANIQSCCIDPSINFSIVRRFFTDDGWKLVEDIIKMKKSHKVIAPHDLT